MKTIIKTAALATMLTLGCGTASASTDLSDGEMIFTYAPEGSTLCYGTSKKETYDVAMKVKGDDLVGTTITKIIVPMATTDVADMSVWMSSELTLETIDGTKTNVPDICTISIDSVVETVTVTLDEPYTLTDEGVYVGYSFTIENLDDTYNSYPVVIGDGDDEDGFYIHSSRTYRSWTSIADEVGTLVLKAIIEGAADNAAEIEIPEEINVQSDAATTFSLTVYNHGYNGISSFEYSYDINGNTSTASVDLGDEALDPIYDASTSVDVELPALNAEGEFQLTVSLTKLNGNDYTASDTCTVTTYESLPTHRVVFEEYTGTWCGFCPRGYVALEVMNKLYPDDFIGISYHNEDDMEIMSSSSYPNAVSGFPAAYYDRTYSSDPYYGMNDADEFAIEDEWLQLCEEVMAPANIDVSGTLSDDETTVTVNATATFAADYTDTDYSIELILIHDSLYAASWGQSNYYANEAYGTFEEEEFEKFTSGTSYVYGLYFNDVIVATSRLGDGNVALPTTITKGESLEAAYTFTLADVVNTSGESLVQDVNHLRVAALLIDNTTGYVANANKGTVSTSAAGISNVKTTTDSDTDVEYYDLSGRRLTAPAIGVTIVKKAGKTVKVVNK